MKEKDKIIKIVEEINKGLLLARWTGVEGPVSDEIKELEILMNKLIRAGISNLSKEEVLDIIEEFKIKVRKNRGGLFSDDEITGVEEVDYLGPSHEMLDEFLSSLGINKTSTDSSNETHRGEYVNQERINELKSIKHTFELSKLIRLCEEINIAYKNEAYYSVALLVRTIAHHIPPIFSKENFDEVTGNVGTRSNQRNLRHLGDSLKHIADDIAHARISRKEILPNQQRVAFQADLDVLLGLIIKELS